MKNLYLILILFVIIQCKKEPLQLNESQNLSEQNIEFVCSHNEPKDLESRQASVTRENLVSISTVSNISYFIHSSVLDLGLGFEQAVMDGFIKYFYIKNCKISFKRVFDITSATLIVISDNAKNSTLVGNDTEFINLPDTVWGRAALPKYGIFLKKWLSINDIVPVTHVSKVVTHEAGHYIGLNHSNLNIGIIPYTNTGDKNSFMWPKINTTTMTMTKADTTMLQLIYPSSLSIPILNSLISNNVGEITFRIKPPSNTNYKYYWIRVNITSYLDPKINDVIYVKNNGTSLQEYSLKLARSGSLRASFRFENMKRDVKGGDSGAFTIHVK